MGWTLYSNMLRCAPMTFTQGYNEEEERIIRQSVVMIC